MAKKKSASDSPVESITLPGKVELSAGNKINYRNNFGYLSTGTIARFWDVGEFGWMTVLDKNGQYDCVSIALQVEYIGAANIVIKEAA